MEKKVDKFTFRRCKYVLDWGDSIEYKGHTLYRVVYKKGTKGGYVEGYKNLSQHGSCCVLDEAKVFGEGFVANQAVVAHKAIIGDSVKVCKKARVVGNTELYGNLVLYNGTFMLKGDVFPDQKRDSEALMVVHEEELF